MIDIGFNKFLTLKIIKIAWVTTIVLAILLTLAGMAYGFIGAPTDYGYAEDGTPIEGSGRDPIWLAVFLSPVLAAVWALFVRIGLELVAVVFKIADNTTALVARRSSPALHPVPDGEESPIPPNSENQSIDAILKDDRVIKDDLVVN